MNNWIVLTQVKDAYHDDAYKIMVNTQMIKALEPHSRGSHVVLDHGLFYTVSETPQQILDLVTGE